MMKTKISSLLFSGCLLCAPGFCAESEGLPPSVDPFAGLTWRNLKPRTAFHEDFISAPLYESPRAFSMTPGFALAESEGKPSSSYDYLVSGLPYDDSELRSSGRSRLYRRTAPGPLLKVGYGERIPVASAFRANDGAPAIRVSPVALIGVSPATHKVLWALDGKGAAMPVDAANKLRLQFMRGLRASSDSDDLAAVILVLILRSEGAPLSTGESYLRRDDTGDVSSRGISVDTVGGYEIPQREIAVSFYHAYHDAPPVSLGFELFAGEPEPLSTEDSRQYARSELRIFRLGELSKSLRVGGGLSGSNQVIKSDRSFVRNYYKSLEKAVNEVPEGGVVLGDAYSPAPGKTVWYATNEVTSPTRFVVSGAKAGASVALGGMSGNAFFVLACSVDAKGGEPAPARFPFAARVLMKLPELPGEWLNRGVADPLDWKIKIPSGHDKKPYEFHGWSHGIASAFAPINGGNSALRARPVLPGKDGTLPFREILRQAYAPEIRDGLRFRVNQDERRIEAVKP